MPFTCTHLVSFALLLLPLVLGADPDPTSSSASSSPSPVSWQSACLGLVPLALNAMAQPSSLDAPFSQSSLLFASRSSPFVCLADALEVIISLAIHLFQGRSPRQAFLLINWQRARHRLGEDVEELEETPAEKHPWGFGILLVVAVLQAAKIFGLQGVYWTRVWAVLYLSSYVIIALVGFLAPRDWRERPPDIVSSRRSYSSLAALSKVLLWSALVAHFVCCSWILDRIIVGDPAPLEFPLFYMLVPMLVARFASGWLALVLGGLISLAPFALLSYLVVLVDIDVDKWKSSRPVQIILMFLFFICMFGWGCSFIYLATTLLVIFVGFDIFKESVFFTFVRGSINLLVYIGIFSLLKAFIALLALRIPILKRFNRWASSRDYLVVFACWNFVQSLLYYRLCYDSKGTTKPQWTDNLG